MKDNNINLSIIICTRNRSLLLQQALASISKQILILNNKTEIIVVDNASIDDTKTTVMDFAKQNNSINIHYIYEKNLGLSYSRNTGIKHSKSKIVAFIDDDIVLGSKWIAEVLCTFKDKAISAVGGQIKLRYIHKKPKWLSKNLETYLARYSISDKKVVIQPPNYIVGANMAFRKSVLLGTTGFSLNFGRKNNKLLSMEEVELIRRIKGTILFNPQMKATHIIMPNRLSLRYFLSRAFWQGISESRLDAIYGRPEALDEYYSTKIIFISMLRSFKNLSKNNFVESLLNMVKYTGYLFEKYFNT